MGKPDRRQENDDPEGSSGKNPQDCLAPRPIERSKALRQPPARRNSPRAANPHRFQSAPHQREQGRTNHDTQLSETHTRVPYSSGPEMPQWVSLKRTGSSPRANVHYKMNPAAGPASILRAPSIRCLIANGWEIKQSSNQSAAFEGCERSSGRGEGEESAFVFSRFTKNSADWASPSSLLPSPPPCQSDSRPSAGQTHLEPQALDLVREMLLRANRGGKTEHAGMVWVGEFRCAKSAIFCSKVPVSMVFLAFFCLKMGVCVY
jgi:hypothetical protein